LENEVGLLSIFPSFPFSEGNRHIPSHSCTREQCSQHLCSGRNTYLKYRNQGTEKCKDSCEFIWQKNEKLVLYLILLSKTTNEKGQSDRISL